MTDTLKLTSNTKFLDATNAANLGSTFDQTGQITLFVPTDSALENQPPLDATSIKYHIVNDVALYSTLLVDGAVFETVGSSKLYVDIIGGITHINCVPLVQSDILVSGGAFHTIGEVWNPKLPLLGFSLTNAPPQIDFGAFMVQASLFIEMSLVTGMQSCYFSSSYILNSFYFNTHLLL